MYRYEAASQELVRKEEEMREKEGQLTQVTGQLAQANQQNRQEHCSLSKFKTKTVHHFI